MRLNLFKRSMIFATFFGSCLCIALIVASLGTTHWVDARARRTTSLDSEGRISFGLFEGHKEINVRYGWRPHEISVKAGTHPARRWAWLGTAGALLAALLAAAGGAVLAALCAARAAHRPHATALTNALAVVFTLGAIAIWLTEYYLRLQHNVMSAEELASAWSSDGMAELGISFWLVVAACITAFLNDVCILIAMSDSKDEDTLAPPVNEKLNAAIMLY